jgi:site-specific DNA-methyltransferase (adenine-specific)
MINTNDSNKLTMTTSLKKSLLKKEVLEIAIKMNIVLDGKETKASMLKKIEAHNAEKDVPIDDIIQEHTNTITDAIVNNDDVIQLDKYYVGDNLEVMKKIDDASIDLIYFDPPYNTGRHFYDFNDKFTSITDYVDFITLRIVDCKRILKDTGTIVIHIEPKISHYFRVICDNVFGCGNFRNEIVWQTGGNAKNKYKLNRFHDTIIVYSKTVKQIFNPIYFPYDEEYKKKSNVKICSIHNKEYVTTAIYNAQPDVNPRLNLRYNWNGQLKQWYVTKEKMETLHTDNRLEYNKDGLPRIKRFLDEMEGIPLRDIWCDISNVQSGEKKNYATQKPVKLLERIVKLYTNETNTCLDIFAGSGTLGRAASSLNRRFILIDINEKGHAIFTESLEKN